MTGRRLEFLCPAGCTCHACLGYGVACLGSAAHKLRGRNDIFATTVNHDTMTPTRDNASPFLLL